KHIQKAATEADTQPASKCKKADDTSIKSLVQPGNTAPLCRAAGTTPRDALPDCKGCNVNPAPKKPTQCSSQEVEAEREAKKRAIEKKIQELEAIKHLLAEVNVSEDIHDDMMDEDNPQRLSVALCKCQHIELEVDSRDEESFDFRDVDDIPN
ncbi:hypothetical protein L208DRAFT_1161352, partial [Tricholoma matsutake]